MLKSSSKVGFPSAKIIIYINYRDPRFVSTSLQAEQSPGHWTRVSQQLIRFWKLKVVDHVDQKQGDFVFVWCAAVEIAVFLWFGDAHF
jgi:hypothetical protein